MNIRRIAAFALRLAEEEHRPLAAAINTAVTDLAQNIQRDDSRLLSELCHGVVRRRASLDFAITPFIKRADPEIMRLLRLGAYQLLFLDRIPAFAAVNEIVSLAHNQFQRNFVNAVLRNIAREKERLAQEIANHDDLGIRYSYAPGFLLWLRTQLGEEQESLLPRILAHGNEPKSTYIKLNTLFTDQESLIKGLCEAGIDCHLDPKIPGCVKVQSPLSDLLQTDLHARGAYFVQGWESQFISALVDAKPGERILDCCAGKGGKGMAMQINASGQALIDAWDSNPTQISYLRENVARLKLTNITIQQRTLGIAIKNADLTATQLYDKVLVDAPCSSLAEIAKYPEVKWKFSAKRLKAMGREQVGILDQAAEFLRSGGELIYAVCTYSKEETSDVITALQDRRSDLELLSADRCSSDEEGAVHGGYGGFFVARLRKKNAVTGASTPRIFTASA